MELFRSDNTEYSKTLRDRLNKRWCEIVKEKNLEEYTDEYNIEAKSFSDIAARRNY